ncbi:MAG: hypothetical protein K5656_02470 [Lachnospiraceae bacterium]|nr:hypothetical protein [Lachnospiraceae bacterium]
MAVIDNLDSYVVIDVECPNTKCDSVCAFGYAIVKDGQINNFKLYYVNPEDYFDSISTKLNNITEDQVLDAPTIDQVWKEVSHLFSENFVVGHNVTYLMSVLARALKKKGIEFPESYYACTMELSLKYINSSSYRLSSIAKQIGVTYKSVAPLDGIKAAWGVFEYIKKQNALDIVILEKYQHDFNLSEKIDADMAEQLNTFNGLIKGIAADGMVVEDEIKFIEEWGAKNAKYRDQPAFAEVLATIDDILEDRVVYEYELNKLIELTKNTVHSKVYNKTQNAMQVLKGFAMGVAADGRIKNNEADALNAWIKDNDYMSGIHAYDEIASLLYSVLEDNVLDDDEKATILKLCDDIAYD